VGGENLDAGFSLNGREEEERKIGPANRGRRKEAKELPESWGKHRNKDGACKNDGDRMGKKKGDRTRKMLICQGGGRKR